MTNSYKIILQNNVYNICEVTKKLNYLYLIDQYYSHRLNIDILILVSSSSFLNATLVRLQQQTLRKLYHMPRIQPCMHLLQGSKTNKYPNMKTNRYPTSQPKCTHNIKTNRYPNINVISQETLFTISFNQTIYLFNSSKPHPH